jgi:hypothetical protein
MTAIEDKMIRSFFLMMSSLSHGQRIACAKIVIGRDAPVEEIAKEFSIGPNAIDAAMKNPWKAFPVFLNTMLEKTEIELGICPPKSS